MSTTPEQPPAYNPAAWEREERFNGLLSQIAEPLLPPIQERHLLLTSANQSEQNAEPLRLINHLPTDPFDVESVIRGSELQLYFIDAALAEVKPGKFALGREYHASHQARLHMMATLTQAGRRPGRAEVPVTVTAYTFTSIIGDRLSVVLPKLNIRSLEETIAGARDPQYDQYRAQEYGRLVKATTGLNTLVAAYRRHALGE